MENIIKKQCSKKASYIINTIDCSLDEHSYPFIIHDVDASVEDVCEASMAIGNRGWLSNKFFVRKVLYIDVNNTFSYTIKPGIMITNDENECNEYYSNPNVYVVPLSTFPIIVVTSEYNEETLKCNCTLNIKENGELITKEEWENRHGLVLNPGDPVMLNGQLFFRNRDNDDYSTNPRFEVGTFTGDVKLDSNGRKLYQIKTEEVVDYYTHGIDSNKEFFITFPEYRFNTDNHKEMSFLADGLYQKAIKNNLLENYRAFEDEAKKGK